MTRRARSERCVCGGLIVADEMAPGPAVLAHGRSPRHEAWRMGLRIEAMPGAPSEVDGGPVLRLGPAEAFGRVA